MSWKSSRKAHEEAPEGGVWFKLEDKAKVDVMFIGEPLEVLEKADWSKTPDGTVLRFQMNLFLIKSKVMQVWSLSPRVFGRLLAMHDEGQVKGQRISVGRRGTGTDTEYDLFYKGPLDSKALAIANKMTLNELPQGDDVVAAESAAPDSDDEEDAPFTDADIGDPVDALIGEFMEAESEEELRRMFGNAWKAYKGDKSARGRLKAAYDKALAAGNAPDDDDDDDAPF